MKEGGVAAQGAPAEVMTSALLSDVYETEVDVREIGGRLVAIY